MEWLTAAMQQKPNNHWRLFAKIQQPKAKFAIQPIRGAHDVRSISEVLPQRRPRKHIANPNRPFRPVSAIGPHYMDLFAQIHQVAKQKELLDDEKATNTKERIKIQGRLNNLEAIFRRAAAGDSANFADDVEEWQDQKEEAQSYATILCDEMHEMDTRRSVLNAEWTRLWQKVYLNLQEYLNHCLDVKFEPAWSLSKVRCYTMRILLDGEALLRQRRNHLRELRYSQIGSRRNGIAASDQASSKRIDDLARVIELSAQFQDDRQKWWATIFEQLLRKSGNVISAESGRKDEHSTEELRDDPKLRDAADHMSRQDNYTLSRAENYHEDRSGAIAIGASSAEKSTSRSNSGEEESSSGTDAQSSEDGEESNSNNRELRAIEQYRFLRDDLETAQKLLRDTVTNWQAQRVDHLLTFTHSSPERYDKLMELELRPLQEYTRGAEADLLVAEDELELLGITLDSVDNDPHEADHQSAPHSDGGDVHIDRFRSEELQQQRAINRARFRTAREGRNSATIRTPTPPSSHKNQGVLDLRSHRSGFSERDSPESSTRKRKRHKWLRHQEEMYGEFATTNTGKRRKRNRGSS